MNQKFTFRRGLAIIGLLLTIPCAIHAQTIDRFKNPIPMPPTMMGPTYNLEVVGATHNFDPNGSITNINLNVPLPTYAYNEVGSSTVTYLGPTLYLTKGLQANFSIINKLPNSAETSVHWHGLNVPAAMDGSPHQTIVTQATWSPSFTTIDALHTAWYHPSLVENTTDQMIKGLAGMMILKDDSDPLNSILPRDYGQNDFPLILQEKDFSLDNNTNPPTATAIVAGNNPVNGPYTLVNGVVGGYVEVAPEITRLRILNASPRKMYHFGLSSDINATTNFTTLKMIASEGGFLKNPIDVNSTLMAAGERREFLMDFSQWAHGDTVYMINRPVPNDANYGTTPGKALMAFVVWDPLFPPNPIVIYPTTLNTSYALAPGTVFKERTKTLTEGTDIGGEYLIDEMTMDTSVVNDTILVNTKERWTVINNTYKAHSFSMNKTQFQVVSYTGKAGNSEIDSTYTFSNLPHDLMGYKDVQLTRAGASMTFEARFDSFPSSPTADASYMYHGHLRSQTVGIMAQQFVVVDSLDFYNSIVSLPGTKQINVYPNPANTNISFNGIEGETGVLRIYDMLGKLIKTDNLSKLNNSTVSVADLPRGVFVIEVTTANKRYVSKVTLQ